SAVNDFSRKLSAEDDFFVVSHHDADGISSCAITVQLLQTLGKKVDYMCIKQLDSITIRQVKEKGGKCFVFTDFGSGQLSIIEGNGVKNFFIIDHHPPEREYERQINPHFHGYDGGLDISGAGMAYMVAKSLGVESMAHIAVVGAVGDMQDSDGKLHSLNRLILEDAVRNGTIKFKHDIRLFGRQSRPLTQMLTYSSEPVLPGLTANQNASAQFIEALGIGLKNTDGSWKTYVDLSWAERKKLTSALYMHLLDYNTPEFIIQGMIGEVYTLLKEEKKTELRDSKEFATLLNACGRQDSPDLGVKVCLGDRGEAWVHAQSLLEKHRQMLRMGIERLSNNGVKSRENLYYFDAGDSIKESIIGVIAGMAYGARIIPPDKPVLAFAVDKDDPKLLKVSARANWALVRKGIHLGNAMKEQSKIVGGEGGGHDIAAGARVPHEKLNEFIDGVDRIFKKQTEKPT
ncbi:MAG: DHH family phosphoesterase, partial [Candidatus Altiarchaeota archaeon]